MRIGITGGSGFIGKACTSYFLEKGDEVVLFTRSSNRTSTTPHLSYVTWDPARQLFPVDLPEFDVLINLAGATINKRWTSSYKNTIIQSRLNASLTVKKIIEAQKNHPPVLISASAIGYYGTSQDAIFTEEDQVAPSDFLSSVTAQWEASLNACKPLCSRVIPVRFGLVLGKEEGAFPKIVMPYRFFIGGRIGSGKQWVSWIHIDDLVRLIDFIIEHPDITGPVNATAPFPVKMNTLGKTIAAVTKRPHLLPVPTFALKLLFGEMSDLLLKGQKVLPNKLLKGGFQFDFPDIKEAIKHLTNSTKI